MKPSIRDEMNAPLRLVFVSRIVANKGLTTLLSALRSVREPVELDIYGPREDAKYWRRCVTFIDELPPNIAVRYRGVIVPKEVVQTFGQYDLFAFPTASENFGHVIAEALAGSCPVAIADCTPWTDVIRNGGGVVLSGRDPSEWARAIAVQARLGPAERRERRQAAGQAYAKWRNRPRGADLFELATGSQRRRASSGVPLDGQELGVRKAPVLEHEEYG
jgi:glycosyltransferase involved in cell wall biosynthesis